MSRLSFLYQSDLPSRAVAIYMYLLDRADKDGKCYPAITTIAREIKLSKSTVKRAMLIWKKQDISPLKIAIGKAVQNLQICTI